jgi:hypothetical protein
MLARNGAGPDSAVTEIEARKVVSTGKRDGHPSKPSPLSPQDAIRAELIGDDECTIAAGITARGNTPILALCRKLIEAGPDPGRPLHAYRGDTLCLIVRSIGEAAGLQINSHGTGFEPVRERRAAPPVRSRLENDAPPTGALDLIRDRGQS